MRKTNAPFCLIAALWAAFSFPALAQQPACAPRQEIVEGLARGWGEDLAARGLANDGSVVELLTSGDGGSWTLVVTTPGGMTCVVGVGEHWERMPKPGPQPGKGEGT